MRRLGERARRRNRRLTPGTQTEIRRNGDPAVFKWDQQAAAEQSLQFGFGSVMGQRELGPAFEPVPVTTELEPVGIAKLVNRHHDFEPKRPHRTINRP